MSNEDAVHSSSSGSSESSDLWSQSKTTVASCASESHDAESQTRTREPADVEDSSGHLRIRACCEDLFLFQHHPVAQGVALASWALGSITFSNIFLSVALTHLANQAAGCLDDNGHSIEDCTNKIYGMTPSNVMAHVAFFSGLVLAVLLPLIGAVIDYTDKRRAVGLVGVTMLMAIRAAQIGTTLDTWLVIAILQAIFLILLKISNMVIISYISEITNDVTEASFVKFCAKFRGLGFSSEVLFVLLVGSISTCLNLSDVATGRVSQAVNFVWSGGAYAMAYRLLPPVPRKHEPPSSAGHGLSLWSQGFKQVVRTAKRVNKHYTNGLKWFFLAVAFAKAGANAIVVLGVVYFDDYLQLHATQIGIIFTVILVCHIVGTKVSVLVAKRTNPLTSMKLCLVMTVVVYVVGSVTIKRGVPLVAVYVWGMCIGVVAGWYNPTSQSIFSMAQPKGQEAEFAGFYLCCQSLLQWAPPLTYSTLVALKVEQNYALVSLALYYATAAWLISFAAPWKDIVEESKKVVQEEEQIEETAISRDFEVSSEFFV